MAVKNIIFDLGNVIVEVDSSHTERGLQALGIERASEIFTLKQQNELCDLFEIGQITPQDFLKALSAYSTHDDVDHQAIQQAWESMILESHPDRLTLLQALRERYNVYLLSNTNKIHYDYLNKLFKQEYGVACLDDLFDKAYYSFEVGLRKPTAEIFHHVLKDEQLEPLETLFIDDLEQNIKTAEKLRIQTLHATDLDETWEHVARLYTGAEK